jgi:RimJ/RimL family protein N-acetyltransferase
MSDESIAVTLRPAQPEDEDFLVAVYGSTREEELAMTQWDAAQRAAFVRFQFAAQQHFYQTEYPRAEHQIILAGDQAVGRLYVDHREEEIRILDLTLLTAERGRGIGTPLIKQLMDEAAAAAKPLTIHLETFNRSRSLFARLGFAPVGDNGMHTLFEWRPAQPQFAVSRSGILAGHHS